MKRISLFVLLVSSVALWAQDQPAPTAPQKFSSNVAERQLAPTYSDLYCSGFVSKENIPTTNHIVGGFNSPDQSRFIGHEFVYLTGAGYAVGNRYTVLRKVTDANRQEMFAGQHSLLDKSGIEYAELGRIVVTRMEKEAAVGQIEFNCQPIVAGDFVVPFQEKQAVQFRAAKVKFQEFAPFSGTAGRIIDSKDFDQVLGMGAKVYVNIGANKGLKPGDYLRITRNYDPKDMSTLDQQSLYAPTTDDTVRIKDSAKVKNSDLKKLPYRGVGELIVLSVTPETATGMITFALQDVQIGDMVEIPAGGGQQ